MLDIVSYLSIIVSVERKNKGDIRKWKRNLLVAICYHTEYGMN